MKGVIKGAVLKDVVLGATGEGIRTLDPILDKGKQPIFVRA